MEGLLAGGSTALQVQILGGCGLMGNNTRELLWQVQ
jgi:hypothetical protein